MQPAGGNPKYDVIVVGASFAGLGAATELNGLNVLLIDRKEIGTHVTSACGTPLRFLEETGLQSAVLQNHKVFIFHLGDRKYSFPLPEAFATFDYMELCQQLAKQGAAKFLKTSALEMTDRSVKTTAGTFEADFVIDATGWKGLSLKEERPPIQKLATALESEVAESNPEGLHFMVRTQRSPGCFWLFPAGPHTRYGLGEYVGGDKIKPKLVDFMDSYKQAPHEFHGNIIRTDFRVPIQNGIFLAGESAGHCVPMSYEGIRPSIYFGKAAGRIISAIHRGQLPREEGIALYSSFVKKHWKVWVVLGRLEWMVFHLPMWSVGLVFKFLKRPDRWDRIFYRYIHAFSLTRLENHLGYLKPSAPTPISPLRKEETLVAV